MKTNLGLAEPTGGWQPNRWAGFLLTLYLAMAAMASADGLPSEQLLEQGKAAFQHGDFVQAAVAWQQASQHYAQSNQRDRQVDTLLQLADAYAAWGQSRQVLQVLRTAEPLAAQTGGPSRIATTAVGLGRAYWLNGAAEKGRQHLETGIRLARQTGDNNIAAAGLNDLGNLANAQRQAQAALNYYRQSLELARRGGSGSLVAKAATNAARAALQLHDSPTADSLLNTAWQQTQALENSHEKASQWLALGDIYLQMPNDQTRWNNNLAYRAFQQASLSRRI